LAGRARHGSGADGAAVGDLFELANAIASNVGGAVAIEDVNRHVLAYSTWPEHPIDDERTAGILARAVPAGPENDDHYRELYNGDQVCRFTSGSPTPRLAAPVRAGSQLLGSLWVIDADDTFGDDARHALSDAADLASLHLMRAQASDDLSRRQRGNLLRRLLETPTDDVLVARQLGLPTNAPVLVAAFTIAPDEAGTTMSPDAASRLVDLVSLHCEARYGHHGCVLIDGTVYALLPDAKSSRIAPLQDVVRHARNAVRMPVLAGIGSAVPGLRHAARSRREADMTLRVLTSARSSDVVGSIDDVRAAAALLELADHTDEAPFMTYSLVSDLQTYDGERGTDYATTLLAYFECDGNIATMSEQLRVHPNTSRYRLGRVRELFGLDFTDPDTRLLLWLQLRISAARGT
ncbi:MAG: helix-turn-helix domain-containing protein, partial [Actinomycetia bacterium]|nr:helix-turn-helix domain-containing protein [Actinomycetes bacterium]